MDVGSIFLPDGETVAEKIGIKQFSVQNVGIAAYCVKISTSRSAAMDGSEVTEQIEYPYTRHLPTPGFQKQPLLLEEPPHLEPTL